MIFCAGATDSRVVSSAGRARRSHRRGHWFKSSTTHHYQAPEVTAFSSRARGASRLWVDGRATNDHERQQAEYAARDEAHRQSERLRDDADQQRSHHVPQLFEGAGGAHGGAYLARLGQAADERVGIGPDRADAEASDDRDEDEGGAIDEWEEDDAHRGGEEAEPDCPGSINFIGQRTGQRLDD